MKQANLLVGAAGGAATAGLLLLLLGNAPAAAARPPAEAERLADLERALQIDRSASGDLSRALQSLIDRVAQIEVRQQRTPVAQPAQPPVAYPPAASPPAALTEVAAPPAKVSLAPAEFRTLISDVLRSSREGTVAPGDEERFWLAARTTGLVDDAIGSLEVTVKADPQNAAARLELADAYVAKLLTVPAGPERGIWGNKAESQWQSVVDNDPDNWDAQYSLAYNYSMYPDFLNKTDAALAGFERALEIQHRSRPSAEHARTYVDLARMYQKKGQAAKAREVLEVGRTRHPNHTGITEALQRLGN